VIVEALASGRPVVATEVGGIPEMVNEHCGLLVPAKDSGKLKAALDAALSRSWDPQLISKQLGRGWEAAATETYDICRRLAKTPAAIS
jgi:glycosyltransferase involved in cell wall biosynthesis